MSDGSKCLNSKVKAPFLVSLTHYSPFLLQVLSLQNHLATPKLHAVSHCFVHAAPRAWHGILFTVSCARQKHPLVVSSKEDFLRHLDCSLPSCQPRSPRISTSLPTLPVCPLHPHQGSPVDPRLARPSYSCPLVSAGGLVTGPTAHTKS